MFVGCIVEGVCMHALLITCFFGVVASFAFLALIKVATGKTRRLMMLAQEDSFVFFCSCFVLALYSNFPLLFFSIPTTLGIRYIYSFLIYNIVYCLFKLFYVALVDVFASVYNPYIVNFPPTSYYKIDNTYNFLFFLVLAFIFFKKSDKKQEFN